MAEISSPISSGIRVARSTVSSRAFAGSIGPDPATTTLLTRNQLSLSAITSQLGGLAQQMQNLSGSLERISVAIANDSALDRQRDAQKLNQERILSEQQIREGKESIVERKIQNALLVPVQKVAAKAQFTLSRLMGFFTTLLGGWLINQGVQTIQAYSQGNTKKLEQIRDNVLKNLGIIGGIYASVRTGLFGLIGIAKRITGKITNSIFNGLFLKPFQAVKDLLGNAGKSITGAAAAPAAAAGGLSMAPLKALLPPAIAGAVDTGLDIATGEEPGRAAAGTAGAFGTAAAGSRLGALAFGPLGGLIGGVGGYFLGKGGGKDLYDYITGDKKEDNTSQPITNLTPSSQDLTMSPDKSGGDGSNQDFSQPPQYGTAEVNTSTNQSSEEKSAGVSAGDVTPNIETSAQGPIQAMITPIPTSQLAQSNTQNLGPLPEPPPIVVPPPAPPAANAAPSGPSGSNRPASYLPSFPTSNPENFYTLYSQVHYNVVM